MRLQMACPCGARHVDRLNDAATQVYAQEFWQHGGCSAVQNLRNGISFVILSFACKDTESLFAGRCPVRLVAIERAVRRKLLMLHAAATLDDLRVPPGNRLERLRGDRQMQYSIRVNQRWRICFAWETDGASEVHLVDYH